MNIPFEILALFTVFTFGLTIIGLWKKIPFMMVIAGSLMTFIFITTDNVIVSYTEPILEKTQENTKKGTTTFQYNTIESTPILYSIEMELWVKIVFMLFGVVLMIGGALVWKSMED